MLASARARIVVPLAAALVSVGLALAARSASACTAFLVKRGNELRFAKNYDWDQDAGFLTTNRRGVSKKALVLTPGDKAATWTSRHASVTFNQYGRELPNGGMNEHGLMIEILWLEGSEYPAADARPVVNELQWIQVQLDSYETTAQVVAHAHDFRVVPAGGKVHYMVCDATGDCAAFEHLQGKLVIEREPAVDVIANDDLPKCRAALAKTAGFGGKTEPPKGRESMSRYLRAATATKRIAKSKRTLWDDSFAILDDVAQGDYTAWRIVYDPRTLTIRFSTRAQPAIREVRVLELLADCSTPVAMLDVNAPGKGNVTSAFQPYTQQRNQAVLGVTLGAMGFPKMLISAVAAYPDVQSCTARPR